MVNNKINTKHSLINSWQFYYKAFKISFCAIALLLLTKKSIAQQKVLDSLKVIAIKTGVDTNIIDANKQLSVLLQEAKPEEAIMYGKVALEKSKILADDFRIGLAYKTIGIAYDIKGNIDTCLINLNQALKFFKKANRIDYESHTITDIALAYYYKGNYELALRNHLAALQLRKLMGNDKFISQSYLNIGLVYRSKKDYTNAIKFYNQSFELKSINLEEQGMLNCLINIGAAYQSNGQFDSAFKYGKISLQLAKKINATDDEISCKENIAASLINLKRYNEALVYLQETDQDSLLRKNKKSIFTHCESYGDYYSKINNIKMAVEYYKKGLGLAKNTNRLEVMEVFYRKLSICYYKEGKYQLAYDFKELSSTLSDTLLNQENNRQLNELSAVYETAEKELQIAKLNGENIVNQTEIKRRSRERNYFILSTILFLCLTALAYKAYTSNKKKKELLKKQNLIIEKSLSEKEILLREIHHRVKNNLQIVSSLLSLQSNFIKDEKALDAVKESRNRVQSMSLIHQNLYQEDNLTGINVKHYIENLTDNLFQSYNIRNGEIKIIKEIAALNLDVDTVIPIGLILNELITNCLKYAFVNRNEGCIKVLLYEQNGYLCLSVYDNGIGLPIAFEQSKVKSFGLKMINAFLQKLKGSIKMYSDNGTKIEIIIKTFKVV